MDRRKQRIPASRRLTRAAALAVALALPSAIQAGCVPGEGGPPQVGDAAREAAEESERSVIAVLERELDRIAAVADSVDDLMLPLPFLRPAEEAGLRRFLAGPQLERARRLGISPGTDARALDGLVAEGSLVRIADSTAHWVIRELDYSSPYLVPAAEALLVELGERFQARLVEIGLPRFRMEVTSVLRSAEDQARLRAVNPNAAAGESTHQYGTTLDVAYSAFAAPVEPIADLDLAEVPALEPSVRRIAAMVAETVAARRSRELQAILGRVLAEMQGEGKVMVTLERLQPVFHMTVASEAAGG